MICKPCDADQNSKIDPLNWNRTCTKGECNDCGPNDWMDDFVKTIKEKKLDTKEITYSQWITEIQEGKRQQILKSGKCDLLKFLNDIFLTSLAKEKFPEHIRKAWNQRQITKKSLIVPPDLASDIVIRTREDYHVDF